MTGLINRVLLPVAWSTALGAAITIAAVYGGKSSRFVGIADDREQTVRFTSPVEILAYHVVAGQPVNQGDAIVTVRRPDLDADLAVVNEKMHALTSRNREVRASMEAEIVQERSALEATLIEFNARISELNTRRDAASGLFAELNQSSDGTRADAFREQLVSLAEAREARRRSSESKIANLSARLQDNQRPINAEIAELERRIEEINRQRAALTQTASFKGQVGSVSFRTGETVPPFESLLTIHGSEPSFVKGFIHEHVRNDVRVNQEVWVSPTQRAGNNQSSRGVVVSLGARIVEFPDRLKVNPMVQAWGREVVVQLDEGHLLLLGERVGISLEPPRSPITLFAEIWQ